MAIAREKADMLEFKLKQAKSCSDHAESVNRLLWEKAG